MQSEQDAARVIELGARPDRVEVVGNCKFDQLPEGLTEDAIAHYREALRHGGATAQTHYDLGVLLEAAGKPDEARVHFRAALRLDPGHADSLRRLQEAGEPPAG